MPELFAIAIVFLLTAGLTGVVRYVAIRRSVLDLPGPRSAHTTPTPRGGGLAFVLVMLGYSSWAYFAESLELEIYLALMGAFLVALIGLADDLWQLPLLWRLVPQFLAAIWSVYWLGDVAAIDVAGWTLAQPELLRLLAVLALVWLLNLYNFMDGIDGIAGSELLFVNVMSLMFVITGDEADISMLSAAMAAAAAGFLLWNWSPAKIFMGDVGSGFSGFFFGVMALVSMQAGVMTVWTWLILLGVFVTDATITLLRRVVGRQRWYEGHASHAYQHAARRYKSHAKVTIAMLVINCLWLAPLAYLSTIRQELGIFLSLLALMPLAVLALKLGAGTNRQA